MSFELTLSFTDERGARRVETVRAPRYTIGRAPGNDLALNFEKLSRIHAVIETTGAGARLSDSGSRNGTLVNGRYISEPVELRDGDTITLGNACDLRVGLRPDLQDAPRDVRNAPRDVYDALPSAPLPSHEVPFYERSFDDVLLQPRRAERPSPPRDEHLPSTRDPHSYAPRDAAPRYDAHVAPALPAQAAPHNPPPTHAPAQPSKPGLLPPSLARYAVLLAVPLVAVLLVFLLLYALTKNRAAQSRTDSDISRQDSSAGERDSARAGRQTTTQPADDARSNGDSTTAGRANDAAAGSTAGDAARSDDAGGAAPASNSDASSSAGAVSDEQLAQAVRRVMSSMSAADNAPYLPESGVRDVAAKVRSYGASPSALAERLRAARRSCADVSAQAQRINLRPPLLMYAALAETEGGADPAATARQMSQKLLTLRATFGTDTANSALLLVAAYPYPFNPPIGTQQRTVHPLYAELIRSGGQRSRAAPSVARSVWFLREQGNLRPDAYELVVRTLAIGVIAQNPQRYGVNADPVLC